MKDFVVFIDRFSLIKPNGEAISTFHLIESLKNFKVSVVTSETDYKSSNIKVITKRNGLISYILQIIPFFRSLKKNSIIFINSIYSIKSFMIPVLIVRFFFKRKFKVVISPRGMLSNKATESFKKRIYLKLIKLVLDNTFTIQVSNQKELSDLKNNFNPKCEIVVSSDPIPKPPEYLNPIKPNKNVLRVIYFGRLSPIKNIYFAYEVFKKINQKIHFDVYGEIHSSDKDYFKKCDSLLSSLDKIKYQYRGFIEYKDRLSILRNYDICFVPSFSENFCHTIYDSLSVGTPIICSDGVPWHEINNLEAGKLLPLSELDKFVSFFDSFLEMHDDQIIQMRKNAHNCAILKYQSAKYDLNNLLTVL